MKTALFLLVLSLAPMAAADPLGGWRYHPCHPLATVAPVDVSAGPARVVVEELEIHAPSRPPYCRA